MDCDERLYELADLFKLFGDSTRMRIMYVLLEGEKNVGDMAERLNMTQSAISHQLSILKQGHLLKARRDKKAMYYSLADDHIESIIKLGMDHILEED